MQAVDFTIISVTLNNLVGLQATQASLEAQTSQDFEWIVIDGASQDGTKEWLSHIAATWISEPDAGIYDAMNKGIALAKGRYLLFLNAGDTLAADDTLQKLSIFISRNQEPDFIYGNALERNINGNLAFKPARIHEKIQRGMFTHHQAMLYRRETLGNMRYNKHYKIASDYDFTCRFLQQSKKIMHIAIPVCIFQSGGISQQKALLGRQEQARIREALNIGNKFTNVLVSAAQAAAWEFRTRMPNFYWLLKSAGNRRSGSGRT